MKEYHILIIWILLCIGWIVNFYKLTECDFKESYKCEVIHGLGVIPILSPITVWFNSDAN